MNQAGSFGSGLCETRLTGSCQHQRLLRLASTGGTMQWGGGKSGDSPLTELSTIKSPHGGRTNPVFRYGENGYPCGA
jgi:hypothetical protein